MSEDRFSLYRLCECPTCGGRGTVLADESIVPLPGQIIGGPGKKCPECRGEGRVRQEVVSARTEAGVGVALVTCAREGEWEGCAFGLLDRTPPCEECDGSGIMEYEESREGTLVRETCAVCKGSGVKPTGTWLLNPWLPSARNVTDAARTLARSKRKPS